MPFERGSAGIVEWYTAAVLQHITGHEPGGTVALAKGMDLIAFRQAESVFAESNAALLLCKLREATAGRDMVARQGEADCRALAGKYPALKFRPVWAPRGRSSALSVFYSELVFVWRFCMGAQGA
jgi:hypothetical protein